MSGKPTNFAWHRSAAEHYSSVLDREQAAPIITDVDKLVTGLLPCPFCGSTDIDPEGWASTDRAGPACMNCNGSAQTVELWNSRPERGRRRPDLMIRSTATARGD